MKPIFIMAGTASQACTLARKRGLLRREWIFLHSAYQIRGLRDIQVLATGTWTLHPQLREISDHLAKQMVTVEEEQCDT